MAARKPTAIMLLLFRSVFTPLGLRRHAHPIVTEVLFTPMQLLDVPMYDSRSEKKSLRDYSAQSPASQGSEVSCPWGFGTQQAEYICLPLATQLMSISNTTKPLLKMGLEKFLPVGRQALTLLTDRERAYTLSQRTQNCPLRRWKGREMQTEVILTGLRPFRDDFKTQSTREMDGDRRNSLVSAVQPTPVKDFLITPNGPPAVQYSIDQEFGSFPHSSLIYDSRRSARPNNRPTRTEEIGLDARAQSLEDIKLRARPGIENIQLAPQRHALAHSAKESTDEVDPGRGNILRVTGFPAGTRRSPSSLNMTWNETLEWSCAGMQGRGRRGIPRGRPAGKRRRPIRFPHAKIRERTRRISSPDRLVGRRRAPNHASCGVAKPLPWSLREPTITTLKRRRSSRTRAEEV
ncbi:hypothetical protein PR048_031704 [Dryococelus australis]|uniref:Uncharacterized protein n=1 Tax=Dryococelus australis TaxID=614101 RepID=A0ABQ9G8U1_9NEOP|nr:hypothetical protein PR048_031704 [Dryococelus australis]